MFISIFAKDDKPDVVDTWEGPWEDFASAKWLSEPGPSSTPKKDLALWSPARFRGGYREKKNVEAAYALGFDVDVAPIPDAAALRTALAGIEAVAHSSSSSTAGAPRWRLVINVSRPMTPGEYYALHRVVREAWPFAVGTANDPSRAWYVPRRGPDDSYMVVTTDGAPLDVDALLRHAPAKESTAPAMLPSTIDESHPEYRERVEWFTNLCRTCKPPTNGGQTFTIASRGTRGALLPKAEVLRIFREVLWPRCANPASVEDWWKVERVVERSITAGDGTFAINAVAFELSMRRFAEEIERKRTTASVTPSAWKAPRRKALGAKQ